MHTKRFALVAALLIIAGIVAGRSMPQLPEADNKSIIVIFGITGDLSKRKLIPAIYSLLKQGKKLFVIGTGRRRVTVREIIEQARPFIPDFDPAHAEQLAQSLYYQHRDVDNAADFKELARVLHDKERVHGSTQRIFYIALPPDSFCTVTKHLTQSAAVKKGFDNHHIIYEKPFGSDAASAQELRACLKRFVADEQVYAIDHYLAKNIMPLLTQFHDIPVAWDAAHLQSVAITLAETVDVEGRGSFYDQYGALKDVVQNHIAQLIAFVALPRKEYSERTRQCEKARIIRSIVVCSGILGQYEGYASDAGRIISPTETYAYLQLALDYPGWRGVPIFITTGKALDRKETAVTLTFKRGIHMPEQIMQFRFAPNEEVLSPQFKAVPNLRAQEYETLLTAALEGNRDFAISFDEIEAQWQFIEKVYQRKLPRVIYKKGSAGPTIESCR